MKLLKSFVKFILRGVGWKVYRLPHEKLNGPDMAYDTIAVHGYAPWLLDYSFRDTRSAIEGRTLVDLYRSWELWSLVEQVAKLPEGDILEVGTWRGGSGCLMARRAKDLLPGTRVWLADTFAGVVKAGEIDGGYIDGAHSDASVEDVVELADRLGVDVGILKGVFPDDTGHEIAERRFRLCHIDVDVQRSARDILEWIWPRLVSGGVVIFDDYGVNSCPGVTRLVNEVATLPDRLFIYNANSHALFVKLSESYAEPPLVSEGEIHNNS